MDDVPTCEGYGPAPDRPVVRGPVDGNAFAIIGAVKRALREAGRSEAEVSEYTQRATSARSYGELLRVSMEFADFDLADEQADGGERG